MEKLFEKLITWIAIILIVMILYGGIFYVYKQGKDIASYGDKTYQSESTFFTPQSVGTYFNNEFGKLPADCNQDQTTKIITCKSETKIEFYVNILNKASEKKYFYSAPCIIKDYKKGATCKELDFQISFRPCGIEPAQKEDCPVGRTYTLEKGSYRVYPGAKCLPEECYDSQNPTAYNPSYNPDSFLEIQVKS